MDRFLEMMHRGVRFPLLQCAAVLFFVFATLSPFARSQGADAPDSIRTAAEAPLFADEAPLKMTIAFDFDSVLRDRAEDGRPYQPAALQYITPDGDVVDLDLSLRTRGYFRLHLLDCDVPPLRLNFKKKQVAKTVFAGQDKLKLVTHCRNGSDRFQQLVLKEYAIYRAYAGLTERSFKTRLAEITYVDSRNRRKRITRYGFLIEDEDRMAERNGAKIVSGATIHPEATDRETMTLLTVFQYMIGNTDFVVTTRHNIRVIFEPSTSTLYAVPYDFDWAGLVDAPYANPDPKMGIRSVRDRKFKGFCRSQAELESAFDRFRDREDDIIASFTEFRLLEDGTADDASEYLQEFFDAIRTSDSAIRDIRKYCLK